jgi:SAM-dependent methyltransferase
MKVFDAVESGFSVYKCENCGLGRTWPVLSAAEVGRYYPQTYYGEENVRFNPLMEAMARRFQSRRASALKRSAPIGRVLDVGCGRGFLLKFLQEQGYEPHGVEISEQAAWHARNRLGLEVSTSDFVNDSPPWKPFNAVVFWHSLEHFADPDAAVAKAREIMNPGAVLAVALPNFESLQARFFGRHWFHLDVPRHYTHFGTNSLRALLERHRFRIVRFDRLSWEQNPYGWLQSFYNALGIRHNLLYELLKSQSARTQTAGEHPLHTVAVVALLPVLLPLSFGLTIVEALLRRGGTIEVYAVKD